MKRIWGYSVSLLVAGTVVGAALPACATNDQTIFIRSVLAPSAARVNGLCSYTGDIAQAALPEAFLDVGLADSYFGVLLVGSQLLGRGDPQNNRAESNRAHINGGVIRVTEPNGKGIKEFTSVAAGFTDPQGSNAPDYASVGMVLIDGPTSEAFRAELKNRKQLKQVLVFVKVFGRTLGGVDVESGEFQLPMQVCNGCLVAFDGYDPGIDPLKPKPTNCDTPPEKTTGTDGPCRPGQDAALSCTRCRGQRIPDVCDPNVP